MSEGNDLISIVVPVYNVEEYIEECLNSIVNQTYKNLEILCINDCSPDDSTKIVEKFSKNDSRIKIIEHEKNIGAGGARNSGIKNAKGKYICFIDPDDFIDLDYIEKMVFATTTTGADIVCNNKILKYYGEKSPKNKFIKKENDFVLNKKMNFEKKFLKRMLTNSVSQLMNVEFLRNNNIYFVEKLKFEDFYFFYALQTKIKTVTFVYNSTYYYRQRATSAMHLNRYNKNDCHDSLNIINKIYEFYKNNNSLNDNPIPFHWLNKFFKKLNNKDEFFDKIKKSFLIIKDDIYANKKIYNRKDFCFFDCVLNSKNFKSFRLKYFFKKLMT